MRGEDMKEAPGEPILVIDDEETIREGARTALEKSGYAVATAANGVEGIRLARESKAALVFVDLKMPAMSGMEVIDTLSAEIPDIVLIVITGYASIVSAVEAMKKGAYDYLPKPFSPDQLRAVTRRGLEHRGLRMETRRLREEKERMERNFITFVSHEMRSPLVAIRQYLEAFQAVSCARLEESHRDILFRCDERIQGLERLVETWLDISRIEEGAFVRERAPLEAAFLAAQCVADHRPLCERKGIRLEAAVPAGTPPIMGDAEGILRVLANLVGNAVKYTPEGGTIAIGAGSDATSVFLQVADTGAGIPRDKLPFVFEPFFRVRGKEERHRGSGLGLTICKKIMEAHNGRICVSSKEGKGTTFTLQFPVLRE